MARQQAIRGESAGPGNKAIATTLLEWLAVGGRSAARDRAERALQLDGDGLAEAPTWLGEEAMAALFVAAEVDETLARSIGHRLVTPDATGLRLYGLGLATPEKAYRRLQSLLPRAEAQGLWAIDEIANRSARIRFEKPGQEASTSALSARVESSFCAFRKGLLEAIPGLYGLLPAEVEESACRAKGAAACRYEVRWHATSHAKTRIGAAIGVGVATGLTAAVVWLGEGSSLGSPSLGMTLLAALGAIVVCPLLGRALDLQSQLEAVAGARRGHLALFDQVDDALAEKLDALARADASLEGAVQVSPVRRRVADPNEAPAPTQGERAGILAAATQIHAAAGDLECWFEAQPVTGGAAPVSDERGLVREIREWAAEISKLGGADGESARTSVDLAGLARRAIATVRPTLPAATLLKLDAATDLPRIECEPVQIEQLVLQLIRNAVEASVELTDAPEVVVTLRKVPRGVELAVEDRGVGIESAEVDEVFDPFFGEAPSGTASGVGLPRCLRIVERHGGEIRIEAEGRAGTRVTVLLPRSLEGV